MLPEDQRKELIEQKILCLSRGILTTSKEPWTRLGEIFKTGKVPETFNFATDVFDVHVTNTPSKLAFWVENEFEDQKWTFAQLKTESIRTAISLQSSMNSFQNSPTNPFTTILVLLPRVPEWWFIYLASIRLGTVFVPGTIMLSPEDIAYRIKTSGAKIVITNEANMWKVDKAQRLEKSLKPIKIVVPEKTNYTITADGWIQYDELTKTVADYDILDFKNKITKSDSLAQIFFTSGTTGKPKMVAHSHSSYGIGHYSTANLYGIKDTDIFWCLSDPGWAKSSYGNFFSPWMTGATIYIHQMERFETKKVMEILCKRPITGFCAPPTLYRSMVQESDDSLFQFKCLRISSAGGEALNPEVIHAWATKTGIQVRNIYGQTETVTLNSVNEERNLNSLGKSFSGFHIRIVDDSGKVLPVGTEGNIGIKIKPSKPIGLFKGYIKSGSTFEIDENHKSVVGDYYLTGDLAYMDKNDHIYYIGRTDDIIISAGYRIGPFEVESILQSHPSVAENVVVASPDSLRGSVVKAFIILNDEFRNADKIELAKSIQTYFKQNAAPYKYPRKVRNKIEFVDSLPKTISGKILRRELRNQEFDK